MHLKYPIVGNYWEEVEKKRKQFRREIKRERCLLAFLLENKYKTPFILGKKVAK